MTLSTSNHRHGKAHSNPPKAKKSVRFVEPLPERKPPSLLPAVRSGHPHQIKTALQRGAHIGETKTETYCLPKLFGLTVTNQLNALHLLAQHPVPNPEALQILISHGLDINSRESESQWTPLHRHADQHPTPQGIWNLLQAGANIRAKDRHSQTAFHIYVSRLLSKPREEVIQTFIENDLSPLEPDCRGQTPLELLLRYGHSPESKVVRAIIQTGKTESERIHLQQQTNRIHARIQAERQQHSEAPRTFKHHSPAPTHPAKPEPVEKSWLQAYWEQFKITNWWLTTLVTLLFQEPDQAPSNEALPREAPNAGE